MSSKENVEVSNKNVGIVLGENVENAKKGKVPLYLECCDKEGPNSIQNADWINLPCKELPLCALNTDLNDCTGGTENPCYVMGGTKYSDLPFNMVGNFLARPFVWSLTAPIAYMFNQANVICEGFNETPCEPLQKLFYPKATLDKDGVTWSLSFCGDPPAGPNAFRGGGELCK